MITLIADNLLSELECDMLIDYYKKHEKFSKKFRDVYPLALNIKDIHLDFLTKRLNSISKNFNAEIDWFQIVKWPINSTQNLHFDSTSNKTVLSSIADPLFQNQQNQSITWRHLLHQTSEWEGELWGKKDLIDRNRDLNLPPNTPSKKGTHRDLKKPGEFWEYNDVRVNVLSYALMMLCKKPLPVILNEQIMTPLGA